MSAPREPWTCPHCGAVADIAEQGFYADFACPSCGQSAVVHTLLANFRLTGVLGYGGMSTVYRAEDMVLGRTVAIKVLSGAYQDAPESRERFGQECSHMAKVRHENVVSVYSAGWSAGHFYIAMEVVEGSNLEVLLAERRFFLPHEALEIIRQVALGLRSAAEAGVLHRDIKPGNVIITPSGVAKVLDFGLAQDDRYSTEKDAIIWATPFYVPPETLRRESEDRRSDIYALGMTLRALLTGKDKLDEPAPQDLHELVERKRRMPHFRSLYPKLDEALGDLVDRMTAFDPADRPRDYTELLEEIAEVQAVVGKTGLRRLQRRSRSQKLLFGLGLGAAALLGVVGAVIIACGGETYHSYAALPVDRIARWDEWVAFTKAHEALVAGNLDEAADRFEELADNAQESCIGAAAAQHAAALAVLAGAEAAEVDALARRAASYRSAPSAWPRRPAEPAHLVQLLTAHNARNAGEVYLTALQAAAAATGCCSAALREPTEHLMAQARAAQAAEAAKKAAAAQKALPPPPAVRPMDAIHSALKQGDLAAGRHLLQQHRADFNSAERIEASVLDEVCQVAELLFAKLKQRHGVAFRPDASSAEIAAQAAVLAPAPFSDEARCIVIMLHGDYKRAFEANPYAKQPDSQEPFAILMRDWKQRLGK